MKNEPLYVLPESLIFGKRQYRAPFKIDFTVWCPRSELLIIASKRGDIMLQRNGWKKCWRVSVADICDPLSNAEPETARTIECITWAPSGDTIAVGMSDGHIYLLFADCGTVFWKKLITDGSDTPVKITRLHWSPTEVGIASGLIFGCEKREPIMFAETEDTPWIADLKDIEDAYRQRLHGSLLFVSRDDLKITILAGGVMTIGLIDPSTLLAPLNLLPVVLYDTCYDMHRSELHIAVTTHGPEPFWRDNKTSTKPKCGVGESCLQTHIMTTPIKMNASVWRLVYLYVVLYNRLVHVNESLRKILKEWQTQKQIFINRLIPTAKNLNLGACLVSFCLHGHGTPLGEAYAERTITSNLNGLIEFIYRIFDQLASCLNGEFAEAVRLACFHLEQFSEELTIKCMDDEYDGYFKKLSADMQYMSPSFQKSVSITVKACVHNMGELLQFIRWLFLLQLADKNGKKKLSVFPQLAKLDISSELKYLIETFIEDEDMAERLNDHCFNIDKVIDEEINLELEGYYTDQLQRESELLKRRKTIEDNDRRRNAGLQTPVNRNVVVAEEDTPHLEKTTQFRRCEKSRTPEWQEKLDKVSELWTTEDDISVEVLERLGLVRNENVRLPNIRKQCSNLRKILKDIDSSMQHWITSFELKWLRGIEGGPGHSGYANLSLQPFINTERKPRTFSTNYCEKAEYLSDCLLVCAHSKLSAIYMVMEPTIPRIIRPSGLNSLHEEFTKKFTTGASISTYPSQVHSANELQIDTENSNHGVIIEFNAVHTSYDGYFFIMVTAKKPDDSVMRNLIRCHCDPEAVNFIHDMPFRCDQLETISLLNNSTLGCSTSDESTRVNMFNTSATDSEVSVLMSS